MCVGCKKWWVCSEVLQPHGFDADHFCIKFRDPGPTQSCSDKPILSHHCFVTHGVALRRSLSHFSIHLGLVEVLALNQHSRMSALFIVPVAADPDWLPLLRGMTSLQRVRADLLCTMILLAHVLVPSSVRICPRLYVLCMFANLSPLCVPVTRRWC